MDTEHTRPCCHWRFENVEFDEALGELRIDGRLVTIEPRPLQLLAELLRHAGQVVRKDELLASVWQGRPTVDHVLPSAMNRLRKTLGAQAGARIVTLPRQGYRLAGAVVCVQRGTPSGVGSRGVPVTSSTDPAAPQPPHDDHAVAPTPVTATEQAAPTEPSGKVAADNTALPVTLSGKSFRSRRQRHAALVAIALLLLAIVIAFIRAP